MEHEEAAQYAGELMGALPEDILEELQDVKLAVFADVEQANAWMVENLAEPPDEPLPEDCKGVFHGVQAEIEEKPASDGEEEGSEEVTLAVGHIMLIASNLEPGDKFEGTLLHEIGHALGMSEEEVADLGLDMAQADQGPDAEDGEDEEDEDDGDTGGESEALRDSAGADA